MWEMGAVRLTCAVLNCRHKRRGRGRVGSVRRGGCDRFCRRNVESDGNADTTRGAAHRAAAVQDTFTEAQSWGGEHREGARI